MTYTPKIGRPPRDLVDGIRAIGAATTTATLAHMGIRNTAITGPVAWTKGSVVAGPALTLQFMPKREDLYGEGSTRTSRNSSTATCSTTSSPATWWSSTPAPTCGAASSAR